MFRLKKCALHPTVTDTMRLRIGDMMLLWTFIDRPLPGQSGTMIVAIEAPVSLWLSRALYESSGTVHKRYHSRAENKTSIHFN